MTAVRTNLSPICANCGALLSVDRLTCPRCGSRERSDRHSAIVDVKQVGGYAIAGEIGSGGMGQVFEAEDGRLRRRVALKALKTKLRRDRTARLRFIEEARVTGQLEHPGIVPIYALEETPEGDPYFCMRLMTGRTLARILDGWHADDPETRARYSLTRLVAVFERVTETIAYAHSRGVVHRDVKPSNVMLGDHGEVWVLDWGLALVLEGDEPSDDGPITSVRDEVGTGLTATGNAVGTPGYMSPEQASGLPVDRRTDVFSLGALLYEIIAGGPPFIGVGMKDTLAATRTGAFRPLRKTHAGKQAPPALVAIVERCLKHQPEHRYASARELLADIRGYLEDRPISALPETPLDQARRFARRNGPALAASALAVIVVLAATTVVSSRLAATREEALAAQFTAERESLRAHQAEVARLHDAATSADAARHRYDAFPAYDHGMDLIMRRQRLDEAATALGDAVRIDPTFVDAQYALGEALRQGGKPGPAGEAFLKTDEISRTTTGQRHLQALLAAGFALDGAGEYERSDDAFTAAAQQAEDDPLAMVGRAICLANRCDLETALPLVDRALAAAPYLWEAHYVRGFVLTSVVSSGTRPPDPWRARAIAELREALELSPLQGEVMVLLANTLAETGIADDRREAGRLIERAVACEPTNGNRYVNRAIWRLQRGDLSVDADIAAARSHGAGAALLAQVDVALAQARGDWQAALEAMARAASFHPTWPAAEAHRLIAALEFGKGGELADAIEDFAVAHPRLPETWMMRALQARARGDLATMTSALAIGMRLAPTHPGLLRLHAETCAVSGDWAGTLADLETAYAVQPNSFTLACARVIALDRNRRGEEAEAALARAAADFPGRDRDLAALRAARRTGTPVVDSPLLAPTALPSVPGPAGDTTLPDSAPHLEQLMRDAPTREDLNDQTPR